MFELKLTNRNIEYSSDFIHYKKGNNNYKFTLPNFEMIIRK